MKGGGKDKGKAEAGQETHKYRKKIVHEGVPDSVCPAGQQEQEFRAQWKRAGGRTTRTGVFLKYTVVSGANRFAKSCSERELRERAKYFCPL